MRGHDSALHTKQLASFSLLSFKLPLSAIIDDVVEVVVVMPLLAA